MRIRKRSGKEKRFFAGLMTPLVILALFTTINATLLMRAGEYMPLPAILDKIERTGGVYGSAVVSTIFWMKQEIYQRRKPRLAVLGSSRVLQFRKDFFSVSFANLGNMHNLEEVVEMAKAVLPQHKPKVLILAVDFWWFNPAYSNLEFTRSAPQTKMEIAHLFDAAGWLFSGKLSFSEVFGILVGQSPNVGIRGIARNGGFDAYRSYYNYSHTIGSDSHRDSKFSLTLGLIKKGQQRFARAQEPDQKKIKLFRSLIDYLSKNGIHTVIFVPPAAPSIIDKMAEHPDWSAYIKPALQEVEEIATEHGYEFYNFHDPRDYGGTDCEMLDGVHAGPILYARLLREMVHHNNYLGDFVDMRYLDSIVSKFSNHASTIGEKEIDFLELNCKKELASPRKN